MKEGSSRGVLERPHARHEKLKLNISMSPHGGNTHFLYLCQVSFYTKVVPHKKKGHVSNLQGI